MQNKLKPLFPIVITFVVIFLFYVKRFVFLKFYPPICNFFIFTVFFCSLFAKETVIQKIAKTLDKSLSNKAMIYTRNLTYVWCVFLFLNFLMSCITIFLTDKIWLAYNGCISYLLIGFLFGVEYIVRIVCRKRNLI